MLSKAITTTTAAYGRRRGVLLTQQQLQQPPSIQHSLYSCVATNNNHLHVDKFRNNTIISSNSPSLSSSTVVSYDSVTREHYRKFASSPGRNNNNKKGNKNNDANAPLSNEALIRQLMKTSSSPDKVMIRLVMDPVQDYTSSNDDDTNSNSSKPTVSVVSLSAAIEQSAETMMDLVGVDITQKPPVVRGTNLDKLLHTKQMKQKHDKQKQQQQQTMVKNFRFRTSIAGADLERKLTTMKQALEKGMDCEISIQGNRRNTSMSIPDLLQTIQDELEHVGEMLTEPTMNTNINRIHVKIHPKK